MAKASLQAVDPLQQGGDELLGDLHVGNRSVPVESIWTPCAVTKNRNRTGGSGWRSGDSLPDVDRAWDVRERFDEYLLDPQKSGGKSKIFEGYGLKKGDGATLERQIREQAVGKPARLAPETQQGDPSWGTKFYVDVEVQTPSGKPLKLTAIFRIKPEGPQMTNALPTDMVK